MAERKMEKVTVRAVYTVPQTEVLSIDESMKLLGTSFYGWNSDGTDESGDSDHLGGDDGGVEYGVKVVILGQEFESDGLWDEFESPWGE